MRARGTPPALLHSKATRMKPVNNFWTPLKSKEKRPRCALASLAEAETTLPGLETKAYNLPSDPV